MDVAVSVYCGLDCRRFGLFKMDVAIMVCRRSGLSPFQPVAVSTVAVSVRLKWMSPFWFVSVSACRRFDCTPFQSYLLGRTQYVRRGLL